MKERWASVVGYEGLYKVSTFGRVYARSKVITTRNQYAVHKRRIKGHMMVPSSSSRYGHRTVCLTDWEGNQKTHWVHRLVLEAFVGPCPEGMEACHGPDRDPGNNRLDNLKWGTMQDQEKDREAHGTRLRGERHGMFKHGRFVK